MSQRFRVTSFSKEEGRCGASGAQGEVNQLFESDESPPRSPGEASAPQPQEGLTVISSTTLRAGFKPGASERKASAPTAAPAAGHAEE